MHKTKRGLWLALVIIGVIAVMAVVACAPAGGIPANIQPTVQSAAQTVQAAVTNAAPTIQAVATQANQAASTVQAAATNIAPTVQAVATNVAPTVEAVATQVAGGAPGGAKDTIVWLQNIDDIVSFDPAEAYEFSDILGVHSVYQNLVQFEGADLTDLKPGLADKWEIKDAGDHWEVTFHLKDGVKFASGNPFTADDVVYTFNRVVTLNKPPAFLFTDVGKIKVDSAKAVDPKTVVVTMPKDVSPPAFLTVLTGPTGGIVDSKEAKAHEANGDMGNAWLKDHSAGSGPYMLDHWTKDVEFLLKTNPNAAAQPKTAQVLVKHVPEAANQQSILEKGDADIAADLTPEQTTALKDNKDIAIVKAGNLQIFYVAMNVTLPPLDKPEVREALRYAIDYDGIVDGLLSGNATKNQSIIPVGLFGAPKDTPFAHDPDKAKALLKQAGVENGFSVDVLTLTGNQGIVTMGDLASKIQSDWAEIGVKANVKQQAAAELLGTYRASKAPIVVLLWGPDFPDPDANGTPFSDAAAKSIANRNNWHDTKAADLAKQAALETDATKRAALYAQLSDYVAHNGPYAVLFQPAKLFATRSNVQNFTWSPIGYTDLWLISK